MDKSNESSYEYRNHVSTQTKDVRLWRRWFDLAEQVSLAGSVLGTVVAAVSQQVLYASVPFSLSLVLMSHNHRRRLALEQQALREQIEAIAQLQQRDGALHERMDTLEAGIHQAKESDHRYLTRTHLTPILTKLDNLQRQQLPLKLKHLDGLIQQIEALQQQVADLEMNTAALGDRADTWDQVCQQLIDMQQAIVLDEPWQHVPQCSLARPLNYVHHAKRERVAVFIDGSNLYHAAIAHGIQIDHARLLAVLTSGCRSYQAFFYTGVNSNQPDQQNFITWLQNHDYHVISKEVIQRADGSSKANLDVELAIDMVLSAKQFDTVILVSGDGDFTAAIQQVRQQGVCTEVVSFRSSTSEALIDAADFYLDLSLIQTQIDRVLPSNYSMSPIVAIPQKQRRAG